MTQKYENLGNTIKKLLFDKNMRPADLARDANIPITTIHNIVTGKSTRPYYSTLETIAKYFGKTVEELKDKSSEQLLNNMIIKNIPLAQWHDFSSTTPNIKFPVHNISDEGFALKMNDSSMEPLFPKDSLLIFEPFYKELLDRSYILIKLEDIELYIFRQLLIVDNQRYIQAINPEIKEISLKKINTNDIILAKLIESRTLQS
jgi:transcriptional regulator with XRE-family HTH domain